MLKKSFSVVVALTIGVIIAFGCHMKESKEIIIGAILPLTGGAGKYGEDAKLAIELAMHEKNIHGGIKGKSIKVIFEDDQSNPQQTVSAFKKLISLDKVSVVIGGMTSSSALAVAPIAEQNRVVLLSPSASAPSISKAGDYIFRNELSDSFGGKIQAELTWEKLKIDNVAILFINNDYGIGVKDAFLYTFEKLGGNIVSSESFEPDAQDFRTQLTRISQKSPEAIFLVAYKESINILKQLKELGIKSMILSTPVFEDMEIIEKSGKSADGVIYSYYGGFNSKSEDENVKKFVDNYSKIYNRVPGYYGALAYDAANLVFLAIEKNSYKSEDIKESLYQINDFNGVTGKTTFDKNGDVIKPVILKIVKNGKFQKYID